MASVFLTACGFSDDYSLESLSGFAVSAPTAAKVGERISFSLSGDADIIVFYSGEQGHVYKESDSNDNALPTMSLAFESEMTTQSGSAPNPTMIPLKVSYDFSGEYTKQKMEEATWTDVSDLFKWPLSPSSPVQSGNVDMLQFFPDKHTPIYLRFDYSVKAYNAVSQPNSSAAWYVRNLSITGGTGEEVRELYSMLACEWSVVPIDNYNLNTSPPLMPTEANNRLWLRAQTRPDVDISYAVVSAPISHVSKIVVGKDSGLTIKTSSEPRLASYSYTFGEPGEYEVAFKGINANAVERQEVVKKLTIKVFQDSGSLISPDYSEWIE